MSHRFCISIRDGLTEKVSVSKRWNQSWSILIPCSDHIIFCLRFTDFELPSLFESSKFFGSFWVPCCYFKGYSKLPRRQKWIDFFFSFIEYLSKKYLITNWWLFSTNLFLPCLFLLSNIFCKEIVIKWYKCNYTQWHYLPILFQEIFGIFWEGKVD